MYKFEEGLFSDISAFKCICGGSFVKNEAPTRKNNLKTGRTLEEAKTALQAGLRKGVICACCGQFAKIYKRKLNSSMARTLITFYRRAKTKPGWVHVLREFVFEKSGLLYVCGDYSKPRLKRRENDPDRKEGDHGKDPGQELRPLRDADIGHLRALRQVQAEGGTLRGLQDELDGPEQVHDLLRLQAEGHGRPLGG
jgi:hypothetical protein